MLDDFIANIILKDPEASVFFFFGADGKIEILGDVESAMHCLARLQMCVALIISSALISVI